MKKMKIFMSMLLAAVLALASFSAIAVYEEQIIFSDVIYYGSNGTSVIEGPQDGTFYAETTATYEGSETRSVMMMGALYDKETGEIQKIAVSDTQAEWPGDASQTVKVKMEDVSDAASYEFKCFMIDDLMRHTPLNNGAPATPGAVTASNITKNSADISWVAALDDFDGVQSYEVYKNGAYVGSTDTLEFTVPNLLRNSKNIFSVRANDGEFLSEPSLTASAVNTVEIPELIFDFTGDKFVHAQKYSIKGNNLAAVMTNSGSHEFKFNTTIAGRLCAAITAGKLPGFAVADPEYITVNDNELVFELTYLDTLPEGTSSAIISINSQTVGNTTLNVISKIYNPNYHPEYNSGVSEIVQSDDKDAAHKITNTGVWKTVVIRFANAAFTASGADGQLGKNFYVKAKDVPFYLASGAIYKPEDYVPMNPNMVVNHGGQTVYAIEFMTVGGYDEAYTIETVDGVDCVASTDAGNLAYKVTDIETINASEAVLEVGFYDDNADDTLRIGSYEVDMDGSGWRTVAIDLSGSELNAGFEISRDSNMTVYLKDIQAYVK